MKEIVKRILEAPSRVDPGMSADLDAFFRDSKEVYEHNIEIKEGKVLIDIKLKEYTWILAQDFFGSFLQFIGYSYFNLYYMEEGEEKISYSYITAADENLVTEMEVHIS